MTGLQQPKVHMGALAAMNRGTGGFHQPVARTTAPGAGGGAVLWPGMLQSLIQQHAPQPAAAAVVHAPEGIATPGGGGTGAPKRATSKNAKQAHGVNPYVAQLLLHLPKPVVATQAPPDPALIARLVAMQSAMGGAR